MIQPQYYNPSYNPGSPAAGANAVNIQVLGAQAYGSPLSAPPAPSPLQYNNPIYQYPQGSIYCPDAPYSCPSCYPPVSPTVPQQPQLAQLPAPTTTPVAEQQLASSDTLYSKEELAGLLKSIVERQSFVQYENTEPEDFKVTYTPGKGLDVEYKKYYKPNTLVIKPDGSAAFTTCMMAMPFEEEIAPKGTYSDIMADVQARYERHASDKSKVDTAA